MNQKQENKKINRSLKLIVNSSLVIFIGVLLSKLFTYFYKIIIARYFGPEVFGLFSLAVMIFSLFTAFSSLGLTEGLVRYISFYRGKKETNKISFIFKTSLLILAISGVIASVIMFLLSDSISASLFHNSELAIYLKIFSIFVPIGVFSSLFLSILRAYEKATSYSFIQNVLSNLIKLLTLILFIFIGFKSRSLIYSYICGIFVVFIAAYLFFKYYIPQIFIKSSLKENQKKKIFYEVIFYSWPLLFLGLAGNLLSWIDSFSIGYFKDVFSVGIYNAAIPIVALLGIIPDLFVYIFFPLVTREFSNKNYVLIKEVSKQVGKWIFIFNLPIFIIIFLFPGAIINLLFGKEYLAAEFAVRVISISAFITSWNSLLNNLIAMIGKSKLMLANLLAISILNVLLNTLLVPLYGINGAAVSTATIWIVYTFILFFQARHYTSILPFRRKMLKISLISSIPIILLIYARHIFVKTFFNLVIMAISFFLIYLFLIIITGCLDRNDLEILKSFKERFFKIKK